jgi:hypothetical protein
MTDPENWTAEDLQREIPAAIRSGDFDAADWMLRRLAVLDPQAAHNVVEVIRIATEIRKAGS